MNYNVKQTAADTTAIRPFHFGVADAKLTELRRRISATRWPEKEAVDDDSQGVQLATLRELVCYWQTDYDWRKVEARLNALPQFITEIDGLGIHFIDARSKHEHALPLIVTYGWPDSVIEHLKIIDPLTNPTAHGGSASDTFDLVIPSMPGYGFSGKPTTTSWDLTHIARAWIVLMKRLGYTRFVAQGGDWGSPVSNEVAKLAPPELLGIHVNLPGVVPPEVLKALQCGDPPPTGLSVGENHVFEQLKLSFAKRRAYALIMGTRPQTLSGLADSPAGLAVAVRSSPGADCKAFRGGHAKPEATAPPRRPARDLPFQHSQSTILALKQVDGPARVGEGTFAPAVRQGPPSGP